MNTAKAPPLLGAADVAALYAVSPNTAYSWAARGQLGAPDLRVSKRSLWRLDRFPEHPDPTDLSTIDRGQRPAYPVILAGPRELSAAFHVKARTIESWRRTARDTQRPGDDLMTPEPFLTVSLTPIWIAEEWAVYARARCIRFDLPTLADWRRDQARAVKELKTPVK